MGKVWEKYTVSYEDYYKGLENDTLKDHGINDDFSEHVKNTREPVEQLVRKYQIKDKRILSIAPASGFEEYWFWKNGNFLTFVDLDDSKVIEHYLKILPQNCGGGQLTYYIGDAYDYNDNKFPKRFDVCYCSSFAPDELRRKKIVEEYSRLNFGVFISKVIGKLFKVLNIKKHVNVKNWPKNEYPLEDLIINYADECLGAGGLFIHQAYCGPIDFLSNPHAIGLTQEQLEKVGVQLLKIYYYKSEHWYFKCHLIIGYKGTRAEALGYMEKIKEIPDITAFNGRSDFFRNGGAIAMAFDLSASR